MLQRRYSIGSGAPRSRVSSDSEASWYGAASAAAAKATRQSAQLSASAAAEALRRHSLTSNDARAAAAFPRSASMSLAQSKYARNFSQQTAPRQRPARANSLSRSSTHVTRDPSGRTMSLTITTVRQAGSFEITTQKQMPMAPRAPRAMSSNNSLRGHLENTFDSLGAVPELDEFDYDGSLDGRGLGHRHSPVPQLPPLHPERVYKSALKTKAPSSDSSGEPKQTHKVSFNSEMATEYEYEPVRVKPPQAHLPLAAAARAVAAVPPAARTRPLQQTASASAAAGRASRDHRNSLSNQQSNTKFQRPKPQPTATYEVRRTVPAPRNSVQTKPNNQPSNINGNVARLEPTRSNDSSVYADAVDKTNHEAQLASFVAEAQQKQVADDDASVCSDTSFKRNNSRATRSSSIQMRSSLRDSATASAPAAVNGPRSSLSSLRGPPPPVQERTYSLRGPRPSTGFFSNNSRASPRRSSTRDSDSGAFSSRIADSDSDSDGGRGSKSRRHKRSSTSSHGQRMTLKEVFSPTSDATQQFGRRYVSWEPRSTPKTAPKEHKKFSWKRLFKRS